VNIALQLESVDTDVVAPSGAEAGRVNLIEDGGAGRRLQIVMGSAEARAIDEGRRGQVSPRPLPWDLLRSLLDALGGTFDSVVITDVEDGRLFRAEVVVRRDGAEHRLAARPSDALALAVRCESPHLFATDEVMDRAASL
jgi:bifunctional DNase/RNase